MTSGTEGLLIEVIYVRLAPNLETVCFASLLQAYERIRRHLGITRGKIDWRFISTASRLQQNSESGELQDLLPPVNVAYFNVGGPEAGCRNWDQHIQPENKDDCQICSLGLVLRDHDFLKTRPHLKNVIERVMKNDISAQRISPHPYNLRELLSALNAAYPQKPAVVLAWGALAFCGVFLNRANGVNMDKIFTPNFLVSGVEKYLGQTTQDQRRLIWFKNLVAEAISSSDHNWQQAQRAVRAAETLGRTRKIFLPELGEVVKIIEIATPSFKGRKAASASGYHLTIQWHPTGHCQIHGGVVFCQNGSKQKIHLGRLAAELRSLESALRGEQIEAENLGVLGAVSMESGEAIPWYFPFPSLLLNGSDSSPDVSPTKLSRDQLFDLVSTILPQCQVVTS